MQTKFERAPKLTTNSEFKKSYKELAKRLPPSYEKVVEYIYDTMEISIKNDYYDEDEHKYFVLASRKSLANVAWCSERKAGDMIKELRNLGYFYTKQQKDKPLKFFTRNFSIEKPRKENDSVTDEHNLLPNKTHSQQDLSTSDTEDTSRVSEKALNSDDKLRKMVTDKVLDLFSKFTHKENKQDDTKQDASFDDGKAINHLNYSVDGTHSLPAKAIDKINVIASNLYQGQQKRDFVYKVNGMIFQTKSRVSKENDLYKFFRWENNQDLVNLFNQNIYYMVFRSYSGKYDVDTKDAYFYGSLYKFFTKIANRKLGKSNNNEQYSIPKQKQHKKNQSSNRPHIHEKLPNWAQDGYKPHYKRLDPKKKHEIEKRLQHLNEKLS